MAISAAKLEANRRNAQKSTGPRTQAGKDRSKMNAVTHGCRAETLVLPEEDPQELEDRRAAGRPAWGHVVSSSSGPSMTPSFARGGKTGRGGPRPPGPTSGMSDCGEEREDGELKEVARPRAPTVQRPDRADGVLSARTPTIRRSCTRRSASTSYPPRQDEEDPDLPAALVLRLRSKARRLRVDARRNGRGFSRILDKRQPWISADKLKAIRLLGRQPFDAIDEGDVALIFLATHRLKPEHAEWAWEILSEMDAKNKERFRSNAPAED